MGSFEFYYQRQHEAFHNIGLNSINWEEKKIHISSEKFFRLFPQNTSGLITRCRYSDLFPYEASIKIGDVTFFCIYSEQEKQQYLEGRVG